MDPAGKIIDIITFFSPRHTFPLQEKATDFKNTPLE